MTKFAKICAVLLFVPVVILSVYMLRLTYLTHFEKVEMSNYYAVIVDIQREVSIFFMVRVIVDIYDVCEDKHLIFLSP